MKIIVLGGSGFVGQNLTKSLKGSPHQVWSFSRKNGPDLLDYEGLKKTLEEIKPDAIFNCAANFGSLRYLKKFEADVFHINTQMALNLYRAVKDVCRGARIINLLSNCSYPGNTNIQQEPEWLLGQVHDSVFSFGNAKRFIYVAARCYKSQYGITSVNFLVPNVFGPGDHTDTERVHALNGLIIRMIGAQRKKESVFEIWGTGGPIREWLYVGDLVEILKAGLTLEEDLTYPVNIAQNYGSSIKESAEMVASVLGYEGKLTFNTTYPDGDPKKVLDDTMFKKVFPNFCFTPHAEGLKKAVEYYLSVL